MSDKPLKIVNASAGSGKTYTLVQEYLRIILHDKNPFKFRTILAMTFTNKAANEMKSRILDGLIQLAKPEYEKSEKDFQFLKDTAKNLGIAPKIVEERAQKIRNQILHNYSAFSVMTIDKFTHRIIRTFARDLNLSVDFDVELDLKTLRKNVTDLLFDQIGRNEDLTNLMMRYARTNLNQDKSWNFSSQVFDFSDLLFKEDAIKAIGLLRKLSSEDFLKVQEELQKENAKITNAIENNAREALGLVKSKGLTADDFQGKSNSIVSFFKRVAAGNYEKASDTIYKNVREAKWAHPQSANKGTAEQIAPLLETYFNQVDQLLDSARKKLILNREVLKNLNNLSLLNHLLSLVEGIKEEQNILLISDFYKKISEIIVNEKIPFIYERMGNRYEHFLLDEFQDTSHLQWINMIPLIHNSLASGNLNLIVGDGKQAIYRWRSGEVEQFTNLPDRIYNPEKIASLAEAENQFRESGELQRLEKNYRSAPEIVDFNNRLFAELSQKLAPGIQYIYEKSTQQATRKFQGYVEALIKDSMDDQEQLDYCYDVIQRSLQLGFQWKDICILVRTNRNGSRIADFLSRKGIKVISPDSLFIGKDQHVRFIFNLICSSAVSADRNFKIKTLEHFAALILKKDPGELIEQVRPDLSRLSIEELFAAQGIPLKSYTAFDNLYEYGSYLADTFQLDLLFNPYLQFFLEEIHLFEKRSNSNIRDFMDWFNSKGAERSIVSPEGANAVQVMTIFKAKGLEFPVVICPFFDWKLDLHKQISWVENEEESLPAYFVNMTKDIKSTSLNPVFTAEESKFYLDQMNLLYVAFTRPEVALFIAANSKVSPSPASLWLKDYFTVQGWPSAGDRIFTGVFEKPALEQKPVAPGFTIESTFLKLERPQLSFKSAENWNVEELDDKRLYGSKLHLVLSTLNQREDLEPELARFVRKGLIEEADSGLIRSEIETLFNDPAFAAYFRGNSLNEKAIIDSNGKKLIPDKIIRHGDTTLVIDFKTGQAQPGHKKQVEEYISLLKEMGYKKVCGEIYYTETGEIVSMDQFTGKLDL
ncbi:MAG: UvrD-helicase domain-containing protein [Bacteroidetes bacterium]|nr:UvrD-helicase domain-containing protein [Bacteroidota bacterium]